MSQPDPFAAVQVPSASPAGIPTQPTAPDPFSAAGEMDDPFMTNSDLGRSFDPSVPMESLEGRLVVLIPRSLDQNAKDPHDPTGQKTRELYTTDLTVLTGGRLAWYYEDKKGDPELGIAPGTLREFVASEDVTPATPFTRQGHGVPQGVVIGKLKGVHQHGRPLLGVVTMVAKKSDRDAGMTDEQVRARFQSWVKAGKPGTSPAFAWTIADPSVEQRAVAIAWWGRARADIAPITVAPYPTKRAA